MKEEICWNETELDSEKRRAGASYLHSPFFLHTLLPGSSHTQIAPIILFT
jgi:hypothetical protein